MIDESVRDHQVERLQQVRGKRDAGAVANALDKLRQTAHKAENTMPATIEAVRAYATLGEICSALRTSTAFTKSLLSNSHVRRKRCSRLILIAFSFLSLSALLACACSSQQQLPVHAIIQRRRIVLRRSAEVRRIFPAQDRRRYLSNSYGTQAKHPETGSDPALIQKHFRLFPQRISQRRLALRARLHRKS